MPNQTFLYALSALVILGFFGMIGLMVFKVVPSESEKVVFAMTGILGGGFTTVLGFHFGTSASSSRKTEIMNGKSE